MIRKGRSASAPTTPRDTGRPRDGQPRGQRSDARSGLVGRDVREGERGLGHPEHDVFGAPDGSERDSGAGDPWAAGGPSEPFAQFDDFETSFGEFESASDTSGADASRIATPDVGTPDVGARGVSTSGVSTPSVATPPADAQPTARFERTSTLRVDRSAGARVERSAGDHAGDHFERSSDIRSNRGVRSKTEPAERFQRGSGARDENARAATAAESPRPGRSLKGRALAYLSRREYSRAELSRKLMPFTDDADALEVLLDSLVREGWLSDARFAESVIHRRASRLGATRIVSELKRHAVGDTLIEEVSAQLRETELSRARAVWRKKYGALPATPAERARQARFLAARGFSMSIIGKILKGIEDDWTDN